MTVHGRLDGPQLQRLYSRSSALLLPTAADLTPVVIAEAAMFGRAAFSCPAGGIAEMIRHGEEGCLVPSDDPAVWAAAIREVCSTGGLARLGHGARARYERALNWRGIAARMIERMRRT
jgi:D-inositol-3-phosphate glycosyltransferase